MMKIEELYEEQIRSLPTAERLRLATMILNDIPPQSVVDYRDDWSDEDLRDFRAAGFKQIDAATDWVGDA
jgi:hypothetical protein